MLYHVWSLEQDKYVPIPPTLEEDKDITVYDIQSEVLSFENYPVYSGDSAVSAHKGALPYDKEFNTQVSDVMACTGSKSMRLRNIDVWYDMEGNEVTEFVAGAYTSQAFTYGDCNDDGSIDTTDLATLKLYLAGSGVLGPAV